MKERNYIDPKDLYDLIIEVIKSRHLDGKPRPLVFRMGRAYWESFLGLLAIFCFRVPRDCKEVMYMGVEMR